MKLDYLVIPECYADTAFIETIVPPDNQRGYNHQMGCNKVANKMQNDLKDDFALGIIDKDKQTIKYLDEFNPVANKKNLFLYKHPDKHHYIIQISPAIERFILESCSEVDIDLTEYGLENDLEKLKQKTKKQTSKKDPQLINLFKELKNRNASQIVTLTKWINYLKLNNFHSLADEIKQL
ncbi:MAG: hypothetical protein Q8K69_06480 [Bacteroidota bacterium]|nr:hypothetical protein [Bacteroidota bacterium]MDP3433179.1 hypothetical protein [Bacteroidota bacterium]MDP3913368.1 hypothetical protein [Bacteroidota bacterium]